MADTKISELPDGGALQATDQIPVNRGGTTQRVVGVPTDRFAAVEAIARRQIIPASAITPRASSTGPDVNGTTQSPNAAVIDQLFFSNSTQQYAAVAVVAPNGCTKFKARFEWTSPTSGSGDATWQVAARFMADGDSLGSAFGTAQTVADAFQSTNLNHVTALTPTVTPAGTAADGRTCLIEVSRTAAGFNQPAGLNYLVLEWEP